MDIFCEDETVCPICQAEFIDIDDLLTHILQVHQKQPEKPLKPPHKASPGPQSDYQAHPCRFCDEFFPSAIDFALHIRDTHIINMKTCAFCIRAFVTRKHLWEHETKHSLNNSSMFSCSECPMIFTDLSDLEYHELNSHEEGPGMMLQPYYPELSAVLRSHSDRFLQQIGKKTYFICTCTFSTDDILVYIKHLQREDCDCYVCNKCNKVSLTKRQIMRHIKDIKCERPKNTNIMKCPNCYKIVHKKDVKRHKNTCKAVRCAKCELNFDTLDELTAHKQEKHCNKGIVLKQCRYCCKSLVGLKMFKQHVEQQHKNNYLKYKYNCVYCERIFDHPQRLFVHFHAMHRKLRPFVCNICDQTFLLRSKFTYHIKLDHESKGFVEFTKDLNVHFNAVKSDTVVTLKPPASLFTPEEVQELKNNNIQVDNLTKSNKKKSSNNLKRPRLAVKPISSLKDDDKKVSEDVSIAEDDASQLEMKEPKDTEEPKQTEEDFLSSDDEPIKIKKKKKGTYSKKLICNVCEQKCYTIENYNRHMNSHKDNKAGLKQCLKCNKKFKTVAVLKTHIQKEHTTSLIKSLRSMVEQRKQKSQLEVPILRKDGFICNISKVFIKPDYRPAAEVTVYREGDSRPAKTKITDVDKVLLRIMSEKRASGKTRPQIVMKQCVLDDTVEPPKKGIKIQKCEAFDGPIRNYESAKLEEWTGPIREPKFDFSNAVAEQEEEDGYYDDDIINYEDVVTTNEDSQPENVAAENNTVPEKTKSIKAEIFMLPQTECNQLPESSTLLIPNEQTKKFGKISVATMYLTDTGKPAYKIVPFEISQETEEQAEEETEELPPGGPKLVQSNPLAHLIGSEKLLSKPVKRYKPRLKNPQLKIAQALMELQIPHTRKKQIRFRPPKGVHVKKSVRPENEEAFKYEILDDNAEDWAIVNED